MAAFRQGKLEIENPLIEAKARTILQQCGYTGEALEKAMGELRLNRLTTLFPSSYTSGSAQSNVVDLLRKKPGALAKLAKLSAQSFGKLITSIPLTYQKGFRVKLSAEKDNYLDLRLDPLRRLGLNFQEMLDVGAGVIAAEDFYIDQQVKQVERAIKALEQGGPVVEPGVVSTLETLANATYEGNLQKIGKKLGKKVETAKDLEELRKSFQEQADKLKKAEAAPVKETPDEAALIGELEGMAKAAKLNLSSKINRKFLLKLIDNLSDKEYLDKLAKKLNGKLEINTLRKLLKQMVESSELTPQQAKELIKTAEKIERSKFGKQILKQEAVGLLVGLITLIGAEKVAKLIGIEDEYQKFAFVLGLAHIGNTTASTLMTEGLLKKTAGDLLKRYGSLKDALAKVATSKIPTLNKGSKILGIFSSKIGAPLISSIANFGVGMVSSLAMFAVVGRGYDRTLEAMGVDETSSLRGEAGNMLATFIIPSAAKASSQYVERLLEQRLAGMAPKVAARSGLRYLLSGLKFAGSVLGYVFVVTEAANLLHSSLDSSYEQAVNKRVIKKLKDDGVYETGVESFLTSILTPTLHDSRVVTGGEHLKSYRLVHPTINKVLEEDRQVSFGIRQELARICSTLIMKDINEGTQEAEQKIREVFSPVVWGTITIGSENLDPGYTGVSGAPAAPTVYTCKEEDVFEFATNYARDNNCGLDDQGLIAAAVAQFQLKNAGQYTALLDKFQKALFQSQIAYARSLDPDSIYSASSSRRLNNDLRDMFTETGELRSGKTADLMQWVLSQDAYKEIMEGIGASSRDIFTKAKEALAAADEMPHPPTLDETWDRIAEKYAPKPGGEVLSKIAAKIAVKNANEKAQQQLLQHKLQVARLRCEYLEASEFDKKILRDMLKAMGDNLEWAKDQAMIDETKALLADFNKVFSETNISKDRQAMLLLLLTTQLDELIKLSF